MTGCGLVKTIATLWAMAVSGNPRKFYHQDYKHTIEGKMGIELNE